MTCSTKTCDTENCTFDLAGSIARVAALWIQREDGGQKHESNRHQYATVNCRFIVFVVGGACWITSSSVRRELCVGPYPTSNTPSRAKPPVGESVPS